MASPRFSQLQKADYKAAVKAPGARDSADDFVKFGRILLEDYAYNKHTGITLLELESQLDDRGIIFGKNIAGKGGIFTTCKIKGLTEFLTDFEGWQQGALDICTDKSQGERYCIHIYPRAVAPSDVLPELPSFDSERIYLNITLRESVTDVDGRRGKTDEVYRSIHSFTSKFSPKLTMVLKRQSGADDEVEFAYTPFTTYSTYTDSRKTLIKDLDREPKSVRKMSDFARVGGASISTDCADKLDEVALPSAFIGMLKGGYDENDGDLDNAFFIWPDVTGMPLRLRALCSVLSDPKNGLAETTSFGIAVRSATGLVPFDCVVAWTKAELVIAHKAFKGLGRGSYPTIGAIRGEDGMDEMRATLLLKVDEYLSQKRMMYKNGTLKFGSRMI